MTNWGKPEYLFIASIVLFQAVLLFDGIVIFQKFRKKKKTVENEEHAEKKGNKLVKFIKKYRKIFPNIVFLAFAGYVFWYFYSTPPSVISTYPETDAQWESYENPVLIRFATPIDTSKLEYHMSPKASGRWEFEKPFKFLPSWTRTLVYYPVESFWPGEKIMIYVSFMSNVFHPDPGNEYLLEFETVPKPEVQGISIENSATDVPVNQPISFDIEGDTGPHTVWEIEIIPESEYKLVPENGTVQVDFGDSLEQGTEYYLKLFRKSVTYDLNTGEILSEAEREQVQELTFTTVKAPLVASFSPDGNSTLPNQDIVIKFDNAMNAESVESNLIIAPEVSGDFEWNEEKTELTYNVSELAKDTSYTVTLKSGIQSEVGGKVKEDLIYEFKTLGAVFVAAIMPANGATNVELNSNIAVTFDQPVDHTSAESKFSTSPQLTGAFSWNGNTMTFNPSSEFGNSTTYTLSIGSGITSLYGYNSAQTFQYSFSTKPKLVLLDIPWDGQDTSWTCNFAATKMALNYKGAGVSENDLINIATVQPNAVYSGYYIVGGGNPHKGYVYGFGTYWEPVSTAASAYRSVSVKSGWTLSEVCHEIANGNPIVTWGQNGWSTVRDQSWIADDGEQITGVSGMHSIVIRGCLGDLDNPTHIYIQDPWRKWGSELTAAEMLRRWSFFGNTGMVVY